MSEQHPSKSHIRQTIESRIRLRPPVEEDPRLFGPRKKGLILACCALVACTGGFSSTIYFPGIPYITSDLHAPSIVTTLTAALFIMFAGIAPVFWASISDFFHMRRFLFMFAMIIYIVASLGAVFVENIWALVVIRCIQSVGVSAGQSIGAGVISDCYPIEKRGAAFGKFIFGVVFGPLLGPILGGLLIMSQESWRATFWFCFAFGIFIFVIIFFFLPETYRDNDKFDTFLPTTTSGEDKHDVSTKEKQQEISKKKSFNPIAPFLLLRHPFILIASVVSGIFFGSMFAVETIIPVAYQDVYHFNSWQIGLSYLGAGIGNLLGSAVGGRLSDRLLLRARRQRGGTAKVEDRLTAHVWFAALLFNALGLLLFGWSVERKLSVWIAIVAFGIQNFGNNQVMVTVTAYLVDAAPGRGASVTAAANFVRFFVACILTIAANPMTTALGSGWTTTLFACLSWLGAGLLLILKIWGEPLRHWSGF
ncbi:hypothetical protein EC973_007146 [Apophysomyces ossiformis]|uniref:Major facilitator superfamily (MFS) profile domain-containing protein n=1 Tax=Apophysomyces ossiformis TaxID=679940 RepID=A0A8H7C0P5_9FUNG|nr:hypothetical protein EC973_007146 [Apophysomyces ossiformis]